MYKEPVDLEEVILRGQARFKTISPQYDWTRFLKALSIVVGLVVTALVGVIFAFN